jgi:hypothetical protein
VDQVFNPSLYDQQVVTVSVYLKSDSTCSAPPNLDMALVAANPDNYYRDAQQPLSLTSSWQRFSMTTSASLQNGLGRLYLQLEGLNTANASTSGVRSWWSGPAPAAMKERVARRRAR